MTILKLIFELISWSDILSTSCRIVVNWMPENPIDDKSALPSGNYPLLETVSIEISDTIYNRVLGHNELTHWPLGDFNKIIQK